MIIIKKISIYFTTLTSVLTPSIVFAGDINIPNPAPGAGSSLTSLLTTLLNNVVLPVASVAVVMWIVYAGFTYVTAQGKPAEIQKAHQRLLWSLVGAGILLGAAGISAVVQSTVEGLL